MISVIVPVYNVKEYLERCVHSILNQTYGDLELILVDDGSTDGSQFLCDELAQKDARIVVIHQANGKAAKARNTGIDAAKGDFLLFVDSDDYIEPDACEQMLGELQDEAVSFVECGMMIREMDGSVTQRLYKRQDLSREEAMLSFFSKTGDISASFSDKLIRRSVFDAGVRMDESIGNEDTEIIPRLIDASERIVISDKAYYNYEKRDNSCSTASAFSVRIYQFLPAMCRFRRLCQNKYPHCLAWYDFYMTNTYNGMYEYLMSSADHAKHTGKKIKLRWHILTGAIRCFFHPAVKAQKSAVLKEYIARAVLGQSGLQKLTAKRKG